MTFLFIGLIYSIFATGFRVFAWARRVFLLIKKPNNETSPMLESAGLSKTAFIIGGIEHIILLGSLIVATLLLF